jgi:hypothetical protein
VAMTACRRDLSQENFMCSVLHFLFYLLERKNRIIFSSFRSSKR